MNVKLYIYRVFVVVSILTATMLLSCDSNVVSIDAPKAFLKLYGGAMQQEGFSLKQTPDGGFIILGSSNSFGESDWDIYLIKVDNAGNEEWSNTFGGAGDDRGKSILLDNDGTYVVLADYTRDNVGDIPGENLDMNLLRISANGTLINSVTFHNSINFENPAEPIDNDTDEIGKEVQKTFDGGYVIVGSTTKVDGEENMPTDFYLAKVNHDFDLEWENAKGFPGEDIANSVVQFDDLTYLITGSTKDGTNGDKDLFVSKVRNEGVTIDKRNFGGAGLDIGNRIIKTDRGYAVIGTSVTNNLKKLMLIHISIDGNEIEGTEIVLNSNVSNAEGNDLIQLEDGNYLMLGTVIDAGSGKDFYLLKTGTEGWEKKLGGDENDEGHALIVIDDGFVLLGNSSFEKSNTMINLIKTNKSGNLIR